MPDSKYRGYKALEEKKRDEARAELNKMQHRNEIPIDDAMRLGEMADYNPNASLSGISQFKKVRALIERLQSEGVLTDDEVGDAFGMNPHKAETHLGILKYVRETVPKMVAAGEMSDEMGQKILGMSPTRGKRHIQAIRHLAELYPQAREAGIMDEAREKELKAMDPLLAETYLIVSFPKKEPPDVKDASEGPKPDLETA